LVPNNPQHKPDPKCKHDGTIEYCSTDAHDGSKASFRGDLQILVWCLAHWSAGTLPWLKYIKENMTESQKNDVAKAKEAACQKPDKFLKDLGVGDRKELQNLLKYSNDLDYGDEVDFIKCRGMFDGIQPKGKSLALKKVKSRKSFVKIDREELPVVRTPVKRAAAKSLKRSVREESSKESEAETSVKPSRKQQKRATKTPAKRVENDDDSEGNSSTRNRTRSRNVRTRQTVVLSESEADDASEEDTEVTFNFKGKGLASSTAIIETPRKDREVDNKAQMSSNRETESLLFSDSSDESITFNEDSGNGKENRSPDETDNTEKKEVQPEIQQEGKAESKKEVTEIKTETKEIKKEAPVTRRKKMMQPGKNKSPRDNCTQTERPNGKLKSWLKEHPEKVNRLRLYLRGKVDSM